MYKYVGLYAYVCNYLNVYVYIWMYGCMDGWMCV